jgi:hypothetical protein
MDLPAHGILRRLFPKLLNAQPSPVTRYELRVTGAAGTAVIRSFDHRSGESRLWPESRPSSIGKRIAGGQSTPTPEHGATQKREDSLDPNADATLPADALAVPD